MNYYIDGQQTGQRTFWAAVNTLAGEFQKELLLEGKKVRIAQSLYWIEVNNVNYV
ncbi:hypothetical protein [Floccifex sp.]|uniref:hypothetical protein n=1 Tax=Floccifex sp. TaxID=2815810 RepID=UPI002A749E8C|nr:hypothetical protein [Floccifex sp.]MDD7282135.1 hypothetical protein [Erysipelotrichaceae bacterium]MDY2959028.1 hypothetical protein [Floccifex sp.]